MPARPTRHPGREGVRGPERVSGQPLPQRRLLPQQGQHGALQVPVHGRLLRRQLRADAGGADPAAQHGRTCRNSCLLAVYSQ